MIFTFKLIFTNSFVFQLLFHNLSKHRTAKVWYVVGTLSQVSTAHLPAVESITADFEDENLTGTAPGITRRATEEVMVFVQSENQRL